jgi:hypothetical protein
MLLKTPPLDVAAYSVAGLEGSIASARMSPPSGPLVVQTFTPAEAKLARLRKRRVRTRFDNCLMPLSVLAIASRRHYGQVAKAFVSWIGWKGVPWGLVYVWTAPVCVSVTVRVTLTSVSPPANVQYRELTPQPFK